MNKMSTERRAQVLGCLVEGNSIRATCRMTGAAKNTVVKLLADVGAACRAYQDEHLRRLTCKLVQCDEIWSFVYAKAKNVPEDKKGQFGYGDVWTWVAIDADSKLAINWAVGNRDANTGEAFMYDLADRLAHRVQLTTDGHHVYLEAVAGAFRRLRVDYAQLVKMYGPAPKGEQRYSPSPCVGTRRKAIQGRPDLRHVSTSYVERQNLTMRMSMRRFTRLTNAFSKKVENLEHAVALHFMWYNFGRLHQTHRVTPAMAAGVSDHVWGLKEIIGLMAESEKPKKRGPYKKKEEEPYH
jgi:IS1 family transposase